MGKRSQDRGPHTVVPTRRQAGSPGTRLPARALVVALATATVAACSGVGAETGPTQPDPSGSASQVSDATATATTTTTTTGSLSGPVADGDAIGVTNYDAKLNRPYPYGSFYVCADDDEPVRIRNVRPAGTTGPLRINRIGVASKRNATFSLAPEQHLTALYEPAPGYVVEPSCAEKRRYDIGVEVARTGPGDASLDGLEVTYDADDHTHTDTWATIIVLCDPNATSHRKECQPH